MNTGKAEFPSAWKGPLAANVPEKGKAHIIDPAGRMAPIVVPYFAEDEPAPDGSRVLVAARADKSDEGIVAKIAYHAILSSDAAARKAIPLYSGFVNYFPDAMVAVAELSRIGKQLSLGDGDKEGVVVK